MKKTFFVLLSAALLFAACFAAPIPATAAHDDFDITYTVSPTLVGYKGADISIGIRVQNTGPTNITGIDVSVTTMAGYNQRWTGTIAPGTTYSTVVFTVPFSEADLGVDKLLYVKIENDGDGDYEDGTQVRTFQVAGTSNIFGYDWSYTPDWPYFIVGDTITITHTFTNRFEENAATGVLTKAYLTLDGFVIYTSPTDSHGIVMPGGTVTSTFDYTFTADDVGHMRVSNDIDFRMMGEDYNSGRWTAEFDVREPIPMVAFTTRLSASPTTIDAGDEVTFTISFENTGAGTIGTFEVRNAEGGLEATTEPVPSGASGTTGLTFRIYESTDVSFVIIGLSSAGTVPHETNIVHITVREPEESPTPTVTETIAPTTTVAPTDTAAPTPSQTASATPIASVPETQASATPIVTASETQGSPQNNNLALYIVIGVLGLLIVAGAIILPILLRKGKTKGGGKRKDTL